MRRFFITLVIIATVVAFFRSDLASDLARGNDYSMTNWFNKISKSAEAKVMQDFKEDAEFILQRLTEQQAEYMGHIMKDRETLGVFYLRYCQNEDINPYIFGTNRDQFCDLIAKADILN